MKFRSDKYVTARDLSELLGVTKAAIYKWVKEGTMPTPTRIGGKRGVLRWHPSVIEEWLEERTND